MILRMYNLPLFSKLISSGKAFTVTTNTEFGSFRFRPIFLNEILMAEGSYEPHVKEVFKLKRGETVIDIGSNIGFYTLWASRVVGSAGKVISIEANPETFGILKSNVIENHCNNVVFFCCAAGAEEGYADLCVPSNYPAASTILQKEEIRRGSYRVPMMTVDSIVRKLGLKRIDWMKIDVEGSDVEVIAGCKDVIRTYKPKIIIETGNESLVQYLCENEYCVTPLRAVFGFVFAHP